MAAEAGVRGKHLVVRADASVEIGTGHVMRCLALAQEWQEGGGAVSFVTRAPSAAVRQRLEAEKVGILDEAGAGDDAGKTIAAAQRLGARWVIVDGYGFAGEYQRALQAAGLAVLFVDDYGHAGEYTAELVLNQNISAQEQWYSQRSPRTRLLLGTDYALLRREFRRHGARRGMFPEEARNILITLGGADAENVTGLALAAVAQLNRLELLVKVAVGPANPHQGELQEKIERLGLGAELVHTTTGMPELMEWADVAVSAAGSTCWELLFMQVPFLAISVADNQRPGARRLGEMGLALTLDIAGLKTADITTALQELIPDQHRRSVMARRGRELVDGKGVERVIAAMSEAGE